ncbi:MAG: hypothetical protein JEZ10_02050 [Verrucomicrobia bacterium]|nr:hypothetical protein [Verrucomicrobiota bacterium]
MLKKRKQTAVKGRSPALIVTIVVHVVFFLIAGAYVAMEVIERQDAKFEAKQIARPKMQLKKLRVPVKFRKKVQQSAPTLSARMTANPVSVQSVDFKMPDTAGLGGGSAGLGGSSASFGGSLGFASTQINLFGLKSSGEKVVFLLDAGGGMMGDEIGGIPAYSIIKKELLSMIDLMPPTALFNVLVFDHQECRALSSEMLPATDDNLQRFKQWVTPLNAQSQKYGLETLEFPGTPITFEPMPMVFNGLNNWLAGLGYGARKGVDVVYWLGNNANMDTIYDKYYKACKKGEPLPKDHVSGWPAEFWKHTVDYDECGGEEEWKKTVAKAYEMHEEENQKRLARGEPIRVKSIMMGMDHWVVKIYFPDEPRPVQSNPREGNEHLYAPDDLSDYVESVSRKYSQASPVASIGLKKKELVFNVIHFVPTLQVKDENIRLPVLADLAEELDGAYVKIGGADAIK